MSVLTQNPIPHSGPGPAPVIQRVSVAQGQRPAAFSQPLVPKGGGPAEPPVFNLQIRRSLRTHKKLAILVATAVCLALLAVGLKQPKTYSASSVVYVEPMIARSLNEQGVPGFDQFRYASFIDQQMQTVVRPDVLTAALRTLPPHIWRGPAETEQSAVSRLAKALTVERVLTSYSITIQLKTSNPEAAAAIVNAVTNTYLQRGREDEFKLSDLREQLLIEERERVKQELETDRKEQAALGASMGLASPADGAGNPYDADLSNLRAQLATARQAQDAAAAGLASVSGSDIDHHSGLAAEADEAINTDPGLSAKKAAVNARRVVLETIMAGITPSNPQYRQAQDEIADLDRSLEAKTAEVRAQVERRIQDKLRVDLQRTADVESKLNAQLAQGTAKATGAGPKLQRAAELNSDIQRLTARYTTVDDALNGLQLETSGPGMAHLTLAATVPVAPDPNHGNLFFLAALPLGLLFGVSAAVLARMRDRHVYVGSDLQQAIGFAPIAVLPAREDVSARVIEEYVLRLAAGVESAYRTANAQSFIVTAVSAGTDTASLVLDLARKLRYLRLRVLMLKASELLVLRQETGEPEPSTEALIAARRIVQAGEGIATANLERLRGEHDILLIEGAPLLHSAETEYVARCADATILIAESGMTLTTELADATSLLSRLRVSGVGAVLDHVKLEQADPSFRAAVKVIEQRSLPAGKDRKQPSLQEDSMEAAQQATPQTPPARTVPIALEPVEPSEVEALAVPAAAKPAPAEPAPPERGWTEVVQPVSAPSASASITASAIKQPSHTGLSSAELRIPVERDIEPLERPRPTFKTWPAQPQSPTAESHAAPVRYDSSKGFDLLDQLPGTVSHPTATAPVEAHLAAPAVGNGWPQRVAATQQAAPRAASARLRRPNEMSPVSLADPDPAPAPLDDRHAIGRFVGEQDTIGAVPPYTRSRIRLAFKEQEVNSRTTWFQKLFRGDPPSKFRVIPDAAEEKDPMAAAGFPTEPTPTRLPEPVADGDPDLAHLLNRIKTSGETRVAPRARPEPPPQTVEPSGPPVPFVERRTAPRPFESDEDRSPAQPPLAEPEAPAPAAALLAPALLAPALLDTALLDPALLDPELLDPKPTPGSTSERPVAPPVAPPLSPPADAAIIASTPFVTGPLIPGSPEPMPAQPAPARLNQSLPAPLRPSDTLSYGRPLRPLTFQQLAGSIEAEALHEQANDEPQPPSAPVTLASKPVGETYVETPDPALAPVRTESRSAQRLSAERSSLPAAASASPPVPDLGAQEPEAEVKGSVSDAPRPAPLMEVGHTGMPMWPKKESVAITGISGFTPPRQAPVITPDPSPQQQRTAEDPKEREQVAPAPVVPRSVEPPSARRGSFERIPILPDPSTDPSPAPRPYRLDHVPSEPERSVAKVEESQVPAGTSFPPDHGARRQLFGRRKTDRFGPNGEPLAPGLTRRWKLLSQFEPVVSDPLPAHRKSHTRATDFNPPRRTDEG